jgi:hypothetical protein
VPEEVGHGCRSQYRWKRCWGKKLIGETLTENEQRGRVLQAYIICGRITWSIRAIDFSPFVAIS